jgi:hypothetical protein
MTARQLATAMILRALPQRCRDNINCLSQEARAVLRLNSCVGFHPRWQIVLDREMAI